MSTAEILWNQVDHVIQSGSVIEANQILYNLAKHCPYENVDQRRIDLVVNLIQLLIKGHYEIRSSIPELISALESSSALIRNVQLASNSNQYSVASRIFLAWNEADLVIRLRNDSLLIIFSHLVFLSCIQCINELSTNVPYCIIPLQQLAPIKKGTTAWTTPYAQTVRYDDSKDIATNDSKQCREDARDIRKMFHCIHMIELIATNEMISNWVRLYRHCQPQEQIILAQICLLSGNINCASELLSRESISCNRGMILDSAIKLCQNEYLRAMISAIQIIRNNEEDFCENALKPADGISDFFLEGLFQFASRPSIMLDCIRLIMACATAANFPVTARIALCQYAWPTMQFEFQHLLADHVTDNRLFEFEQFREQILHLELVDTFLALHRAGKLHMKLGVPQDKPTGRMLRGATRNLSITTEKDLEDHVVNCGRIFQSLGSVLFNLITNDLYSLCCR